MPTVGQLLITAVVGTAIRTGRVYAQRPVVSVVGEFPNEVTRLAQLSALDGAEENSSRRWYDLFKCHFTLL